MSYDIDFHVKMEAGSWSDVISCLGDMATAVAGALSSGHTTAVKSTISIDEQDPPPAP